MQPSANGRLPASRSSSAAQQHRAARHAGHLVPFCLGARRHLVDGYRSEAGEARRVGRLRVREGAAPDAVEAGRRAAPAGVEARRKPHRSVPGQLVAQSGETRTERRLTGIDHRAGLLVRDQLDQHPFRSDRSRGGARPDKSFRFHMTVLVHHPEHGGIGADERAHPFQDQQDELMPFQLRAVVDQLVDVRQECPRASVDSSISRAMLAIVLLHAVLLQQRRRACRKSWRPAPAPAPPRGRPTARRDPAAKSTSSKSIR